jgi:hypothetical protein
MARDPGLLLQQHQIRAGAALEQSQSRRQADDAATDDAIFLHRIMISGAPPAGNEAATTDPELSPMTGHMIAFISGKLYLPDSDFPE